MEDDKVISVSQFANYIKSIFLAEEMLFNISIFGEVSAMSISRGIAYFNLKDENAIISCVCFDSERIFSIKDGDKIVATGTPNYYVKGGKLNFNVSAVRLYGEGDLYKRFIELKTKLEKEGLFDSAIKKQLPKEIKNIGVATSSTGAVIQDIINVVSRRNPSLNIFVAPCKVQGINAEKEISNSIRFLDKQNYDVIIVARGGGSIEDLSPFNTEIIARTIFNCKTPVISAVGHETDYTISDFVADLRAPTPSVAGELVSIEVNQQKAMLNSLQNRLIKKSNLFQNYFGVIFDKWKKLNKAFEQCIRQNQIKIDKTITKFSVVSNSYFSDKIVYFNLLQKSFEHLNPENFTRLGYSKVLLDGNVIKDLNQIKINDNLNLQFYDGELTATVNKKRRYNEI